MSGAVVAVVSDLHCGSSVGLCPSDGITLDDGQVILPSKAQRWLWKQWQAFWAEVFERAGKRQVIAILNGDSVEGLHHHTTQLMASRVDVHERIAVECAREFAGRVASIYVTRGTPAHVGTGAQSEERIAREIGAVPESKERHSHYHLRLKVEGVRLDVAHHRGGSRRYWTKITPIRVSVLQSLMAYAEAGAIAPHVVIRSHSHLFEDTGETYSVRGIGIGAWQLATEFVHRIAPEQLLADIGGLILECEDGKYTAHIKKYTPRGRATWKTWAARR